MHESGHIKYLNTQYSFNRPHLECLFLQVRSLDFNASFGLRGGYLSWGNNPFWAHASPKDFQNIPFIQDLLYTD